MNGFEEYINGIVHFIYLQTDDKGCQASIINKLDASLGGVQHIINKKYNPDEPGKKVAVDITRYLNRRKEKQLTFKNGSGDKVKDKSSTAGFIFTFVRLFKGRYEVTDVVDDYTIGYMLVNKSELLKHYHKSRMDAGLSKAVKVDMLSTLDDLNNNFKIRYF